jgi:hypothetical protein
VIDPLPLNHKKKSDKLVESLNKIIDDNLAYIEFKIAERIQLTSTEYFVNVLQLKKEKVLELIDASESIRYLKSRLGVNYIFDRKHISRMKHAILQNMEKYHKSNPLSVMGVSKKKLALFTKDVQSSIDSSSNDEILSFAIEELENDKKLIRSLNNWILPNQCTEFSAEVISLKKLVESFLLEN